MFKPLILVTMLLGLSVTACTETALKNDTNDVVKPRVPTPSLTYPVPLADFSAAAEKLLGLSPQGIAIGEVHGQIAGVMMLEAMMTAALAQGKAVLILHEFTPNEAGLNLSDVPLDDFRTIDMTSQTMPFWTDNRDKRATWELLAFFKRLERLPNVELSYLWDERLNPRPNKLKAHGFAQRWKIAQTTRPESYIIALGGNYHTSSSDQYRLDVTNSMCRYADERLDIQITCMAVDSVTSPNENCKEGQQALVLKGEDIFQDWDYVVRRPDGCVVKAHWVNGPK